MGMPADLGSDLGTDLGGGPWAANRVRALTLRERYPFAAEVLDFYLVLLDVWQEAWQAVGAARPPPERLARWAADQVLPAVMKAAETAGPPALAQACRDLRPADDLGPALDAWLAGAELAPVPRFLARASLVAPLAALGEQAGAACAADPSRRTGGHCPRCGGLPQYSVRGRVDDPLVTGQRSLVCGRCGHGWTFSGSTCPACAQTAGAKRTVYAEQRTEPVVRTQPAPEPAADPRSAATDQDAPTFPHLRIDGCAGCGRYLIDVDISRDGRAVPELDEMAAIPLFLYAADHGLSKITPNLVGF